MADPLRTLRRATWIAAAVIAGISARPVAGEPTILSSSDGDFAEGGTDTCLECHDESEKHPVLSILATPHAALGDPRSPLAQKHGCETCHGPSAAHVDEESTPVDVVFGKDAPPGPRTKSA